MKKLIVLFCLCVLIVQFFQIIYSQRALFSQNYDVEYWKDRFEHSQWALPLSKRIIGDDGLFAYIGYDLINGGSITGFDSEVPPLGKYLIGASIKVFNNPYYHSVLFGLGSLIVFYSLSLKVLKSKTKSFVVTSILFLDPLFFSQFWKSMLDIYQLFFLLLNVFLIVMILENKKNIFLLSLLSGISLGFFSQTKYPMLLPVIISLETIFFLSKKLRREYIVFLTGFFIAFLISNFKFFLDGGSLIEFIKFQKYVLSFYLNSQLVVNSEAIWSTLFLGKFPEIVGSKIINVEEWWFMWPLAGFLAIPFAVVDVFRRNSKIWKGFALFILLSFLTYSLAPIYPRYLLLVLPFMYLFVVRTLFRFNIKISKVFFIIVLLYGLFNARIVLQDAPEKILSSFYYNFSHQYFQDVYEENISTKAMPIMTRDKFRLLSQGAFSNAGVKAIELKEIQKHTNELDGTVKVKVEYLTEHLGSFSEVKNIKLLKESGKWKIQWDWDLIFEGFLPDYSIETTREPGRRGSIVDSSGKILTQDFEGYLISVNPEKIDLKKENEMLDFIGRIGDVKPPHLQNAYLENTMPGTYVPLVSLFFPLDNKTRMKLLSFSGVKLSPYPSRVYSGLDPLGIKNTLYDECCTRIYNSNYHGIEGVEKQFDSILAGQDGGEITIKDKKGFVVKTIYEREVKKGSDVVVSL